MTEQTDKKPLRSRAWFNNPDNIDMTALYLERYMNFGLSLAELAIRPADHRHRADRFRSLAVQSPSPRPRRPSARRASARPAASRSNSRSTRSRKPASGRPPGSTATLAYLGLVEVLYGYPIDGVVLTIGCDKTTPACLMAAGHREHPGDRAFRPAPCSTAGSAASAPARAPSCGRRASCWPPARSDNDGFPPPGSHPPRRPPATCNTMGHGYHDELAGRGARHAAAGRGRHSGALPAIARKPPT